MSDHFAEWMRDLEAEHLADLTFAETARALRALSSIYVERRRRLNDGAALDGAGKKAAFALFYGPIHFLLVRHIVSELGAGSAAGRAILDLGCGTGAAGAAWAGDCRTAPFILGIDRHPWSVKQAGRTYRRFGLKHRTLQADLTSREWPRATALAAAFALNELAAPARRQAIDRLVERGRRGDSVLIVEPLAGFVAPWWDQAAGALEALGGRADEWRVRIELPEVVAKLDRAAGLDHREITGRSLWLRGRSGGSG
jgi:hypothetical protein